MRRRQCWKEARKQEWVLPKCSAQRWMSESLSVDQRKKTADPSPASPANAGWTCELVNQLSRFHESSILITLPSHSCRIMSKAGLLLSTKCEAMVATILNDDYTVESTLCLSVRPVCCHVCSPHLPQKFLRQNWRPPPVLRELSCPFPNPQLPRRHIHPQPATSTYTIQHNFARSESLSTTSTACLHSSTYPILPCYSFGKLSDPPILQFNHAQTGSCSQCRYISLGVRLR